MRLVSFDTPPAPFDSREYKRQWRHDNPDLVRAQRERWLEKNGALLKSIKAAWYRRNRERVIAQTRVYRTGRCDIQL
jgi:hypothetical protein